MLKSDVTNNSAVCIPQNSYIYTSFVPCYKRHQNVMTFHVNRDIAIVLISSVSIMKILVIKLYQFAMNFSVGVVKY